MNCAISVFNLEIQKNKLSIGPSLHSRILFCGRTERHTLKDTDRQQRWVISVKIFVWPEIFIFQWEVSLRPQHHSWEGERRHSPQHGGRDWPAQRQGAGADVPAHETPLRSGQNFNMISVCDSPSSSHQSTPSIRGLECRFYHLILSRDQTST